MYNIYCKKCNHNENNLKCILLYVLLCKKRTTILYTSHRWFIIKYIPCKLLMLMQVLMLFSVKQCFWIILKENNKYEEIHTKNLLDIWILFAIVNTRFKKKYWWCITKRLRNMMLLCSFLIYVSKHFNIIIPL